MNSMIGAAVASAAQRAPMSCGRWPDVTARLKDSRLDCESRNIDRGDHARLGGPCPRGTGGWPRRRAPAARGGQLLNLLRDSPCVSPLQPLRGGARSLLAQTKLGLGESRRASIASAQRRRGRRAAFLRVCLLSVCSDLSSP